MPSDAPPQSGEQHEPEASAADNGWYVQLLGGLCVARLLNAGDTPFGTAKGAERDASVPPRFETHKAALLFARLILYPFRSHGRDELADWLWPDLPADKGRANLSQALRRLKIPFAGGSRSGGSKPSAPLFIADHQTVRARAGAFQTDVTTFEKRVRDAERAQNAPPPERAAHWKAALERYTGDLLPGFYDDWIETERQRLRDLFDRAKAKYEEAEQAAQNKELAAPKTSSAPKAVAATPQIVGFPLTLTRFFGRDAELADLCARLAETDSPARLITVVGAGGMGKTRLAVQAAQQMNPVFAFAAFVSLADVSNADLIAAALTKTLVPTASEKIPDATDALALVTPFLLRAGSDNNGRVLLVLDNLEQFGGTCAPIVTHLLVSVPTLTILATSRQPVGVSGEQELSLGPLLAATAAGAESAGLPPDVALFVDRARLVRPQFMLTPHNEPSVWELCGVLEGVPLAIELAAAWVRTHSLAQINERLNRRFDLLQRRGAVHGDLPKRHQSLHAAIAWSYDLLPPNLQTFWAQLSLFRGGWTVEAARAVTGINEVTTPLLLLAERSLILVDEDEATGTTRYRMLESLREFSHEQWEAQKPNIKNAARLRHARYFADLSCQSDAMPQSKQVGRPGLALLGPERDNLRVIFTGLQDVTRQSESGDRLFFAPFVQAAVDIIAQSVWFWPGKEIDSYLQWAAEAIRYLPDETTSRALRARVLALQGRRASLTGDYATATRLLNESIALWQSLNNVKEAVLVRNFCAAQAWTTGNSAEAFAILSESLRFAQETGDLRMESAMLHNVAIVGPDLEQRRRWIEQAVSLNREHWPSSTFHAASLSCMGVIAYEQEDWKIAQACLEEANEIASSDGAIGMAAVAKEGLAGFFHKTNTSLERADDLLREAHVLYEELQEWPRIANVLLTRFQVALKRNDVTNALDFARSYLTVNRDARLMDEAQLCAAQAELTKQLPDAGYAAPLSFGAPF